MHGEHEVGGGGGRIAVRRPTASTPLKLACSQDILHRQAL